MTVTRGYTFGATETVTNTKLHTLVDSATVSALTQAAMTAGVITVSGSAPSSPSTGHAWFDTSLGAGYGTLRIYDNGEWKAVAEGFIALNNGLTAAQGAPVRIDTSVTSNQAGARMAVVRGTAPSAGVVQQQIPIGVLAEQIVNGGVGVVLTRGKVKATKDSVNITAGDPMCISSVTDAQWSTNSVGSWGTPFGSGTCGVWLETSSAAAGTQVTGYLFGQSYNSWNAYKSAPAVLLNEVSPSALATWQTAVAWSSSPAGCVAHLVQVRLKGTAAVTAGQFVFGMRANGSSLTIDTGASFISASTDDSSANAREGLRGMLIVPMGTTDNSFQWYVDTGTTLTAAQMSVILHEVGAIVGGQVV